MGKRLLNLHAWHWRNCMEYQRHPTSLVLNAMAVPLFILAALLIIDGVVSLSFSSLAIGVIGLIAAWGIEHHGRDWKE